jgi:hypothetical protein
MYIYIYVYICIILNLICTLERERERERERAHHIYIVNYQSGSNLDLYTVALKPLPPVSYEEEDTCVI